MKVKKIELNNFRSFQHFEVELGEQLNVFVGINGAGKTSILDSLAILLSRLIGKIRSSHATGRSFSDADIRLGTSETVNNIEITLYDLHANWTVTKNRRGRKKQTISNLVEVKELAELVQEKFGNDEKASLPFAVYYSVNRSVLDIPLRIQNKQQFGRLEAHDQALTGARNDFRLFFEWFRNREDLENEQRLYPDENIQAKQTGNSDDSPYFDLQLQAVRGCT